MADLIDVGNNGLIDKINNGLGLDKVKPFSQKIFLLEVHIVGTTYVENMEKIEPKIKEGLEVSFYREPDNKYDPKAIVAKDNEGEKIGYISRNENEVISRLMDAGKLIYGVIKIKEKSGNWIKIKADVYLRD